jgi:hypothetical protein
MKPNNWLSISEYVVTVETGDKRGAGTNSRVYITLVGADGSTPKTELVGDRYTFCKP